MRSSRQDVQGGRAAKTQDFQGSKLGTRGRRALFRCWPTTLVPAQIPTRSLACVLRLFDVSFVAHVPKFANSCGRTKYITSYGFSSLLPYALRSSAKSAADLAWPLCNYKARRTDCKDLQPVFLSTGVLLKRMLSQCLRRISLHVSLRVACTMTVSFASLAKT